MNVPCTCWNWSAWRIRRRNCLATSQADSNNAPPLRALANDPPLIVADEPTGNLDAQTSDDVLNLFSHLVDQGKTLVMVTHNDELACQTPRRVVVRNGLIAHDGPCEG